MLCSPGFPPSCSTTHHKHLNSHPGDFPHPRMEGVNSRGGMLRKKRSGRSRTHLPPLASKLVPLLFFHPPDASWEVQKFTTYILPMLPGIHRPGRTFRTSPYLLKFSRLAYRSVHLVYHPHSKEQTYNKKILFIRITVKVYFWDLSMCRDNKKTYTNLKGFWNATKKCICVSKILNYPGFESSVP